MEEWTKGRERRAKKIPSPFCVYCPFPTTGIYGTSVVIRGTRFHSALLKGGELGTNFPQDDWEDLMSSHELT